MVSLEQFVYNRDWLLSSAIETQTNIDVTSSFPIKNFHVDLECVSVAADSGMINEGSNTIPVDEPNYLFFVNPQETNSRVQKYKYDKDGLMGELRIEYDDFEFIEVNDLFFPCNEIARASVNWNGQEYTVIFELD